MCLLKIVLTSPLNQPITLVSYYWLLISSFHWVKLFSKISYSSIKIILLWCVVGTWDKTISQLCLARGIIDYNRKLTKVYYSFFIPLSEPFSKNILFYHKNYTIVMCCRHLRQDNISLYCLWLEELLTIIGSWRKFIIVGKFSQVFSSPLLLPFLSSTGILFMQLFSRQLSSFPATSLFLCSYHLFSSLVYSSCFLKWVCINKV